MGLLEALVDQVFLDQREVLDQQETRVQLAPRAQQDRQEVLALQDLPEARVSLVQQA